MKKQVLYGSIWGIGLSLLLLCLKLLTKNQWKIGIAIVVLVFWLIFTFCIIDTKKKQ
ncbi:hypothetical protein [Enterococcus sp. DIV0421]|uniref:hypothetical protein n=1 Tax=Enterococcus sp. DIV0421 TaxID=2774688 RepID=UPI003F682DAA